MSNTNGRTFGHIPGIEVGRKFPSKMKLLEAGVHMMQGAGIHADQDLGAYSICLSKGYEDNIDNGATITYVGSGGRTNGDQTKDQSPEHPPNKALFVSHETRRPVRVIRGVNDENHYSPPEGYRYDGLYVVEEASMQRGKLGFNMCTFKLKRIEEEGQKGVPARNLLAAKLSKMNRKARSS